MRHSRDDDIADAPSADLAWARLAGLVAIHPDGSWNLTPEGMRGLIKLLANAPLGVTDIQAERGPLH